MAQRIKESIFEKEYKKLMILTKNDEDLREFTKDRFLKAFTILYYTGMRVNELLQFRNVDILNLTESGEYIIYTPKTDKERKLYLSEKGIKDISKLFKGSINEDCIDNYIISKNNQPTINLHPVTFNTSMNTQIQKCLGDRYSSHSFRQGLITEMSANGTNPKIVQEMMGHSDIKTTLGYFKPSEVDIRKAMSR